MARTPPIPAGQPLDATRKAAEQVLTLAGAEVVAVQAAVSVTLAALLWPLIPAAHAVAGLASALSPRRLLPEQEASAPAKVVVVSARIGRCRTGHNGARRAARGGARGGDHAGGGGGVRAAGPVHRRYRAWPPPAWCGCSPGSRGCGPS